MWSRLVPLGVLAFALASVIGCGPGKVNVAKTIDLESGEGKSIDLPAVTKPQTINVEFTSSDADIYVYVCKEEDAKGDDGLMVTPKNSLAKAHGKSGTLSAEVPERTPTRVIFRGADKKTKVDVKVHN